MIFLENEVKQSIACVRKTEENSPRGGCLPLGLREREREREGKKGRDMAGRLGNH